MLLEGFAEHHNAIQVYQALFHHKSSKNMYSIRYWNVIGALIRLNGITLTSKWYLGVEKLFFFALLFNLHLLVAGGRVQCGEVGNTSKRLESRTYPRKRG